MLRLKSLQASHRKIKINFEIILSNRIRVDFPRDFLWEKREMGLQNGSSGNQDKNNRHGTQTISEMQVNSS